jgi:nitrate/TMAO reductase-like tetraheme cytochrome c subunit
MDGGKITLLIITLTAIGVLVLPNTVSLFAGQHYWYNLSGEGNDIPCEKCHADIYEELRLSNFHIHWGDNTTADRQDCEACHRGNLSITYAKVGPGYTTYTPGKQAHAASVVACMLCHQNNSAAATNYAGYYAGGFNITDLRVTSPYDYSNATYHGHFEAHNAFVAKAIQNTTLQDSNEACVACHTHVAVKINWTHARSLEFVVGIGSPMTTEYGPHNWTLTQWNVNGTAYATVWGNTTGYGSTTYTDNWPGDVDNIYS